jgi:hypothetical protein
MGLAFIARDLAVLIDINFGKAFLGMMGFSSFGDGNACERQAKDCSGQDDCAGLHGSTFFWWSIGV